MGEYAKSISESYLFGWYLLMIFVTLGSQNFQFNRLLKQIDILIEQGIITDKVFAQIGASDYKPVNFEYKNFLNRDEFSDIMDSSKIVITHGGTGAIIGAVKKGKKVIAVPRLAKYGEHVDDHQIQLLQQFDGMGIIKACYDIANLERCYLEINNIVVVEYHSNTIRIIESIEYFLNGSRI